MRDRPHNVKARTPKEAPVDNVQQAMAHARAALPEWRALSVNERLRPMLKLATQLADDLDDWVAFLTQSLHKTPSDALRADIVPVLDVISFLQRHASRTLAPRSTRSWHLGGWERAHVHRIPYGVCAIAAPYNFPLQLSLIPTLYALICGNTVVLKPSEHVPNFGDRLRALFEAAAFPPHTVSVCDGDGTTFQAIVKERPQLVFVTGGVHSGTAIYETCAKQLIPCMLELSGHDAMIVCADAHVPRAVHASVWGAMMNCGQVCMGVETAYVHRSVLDAYVRLVREVLPSASIGGMAHIDAWKRTHMLVADAVENGATVVAGGVPMPFPYMQPTVLTDVHARMKLWHEASFGPVLCIVPFDDIEEVTIILRSRPHVLGINVCTQAIDWAQTWCASLPVGQCAINHVFGALLRVDVPFGGMGQSGFGRYRGIEGMHAFSTTQTMTIRAARRVRDIPWFPYTSTTDQWIRRLVRWRWGKWRSLDKND
jgi:acyl-CoA reductase-like NAD-dependent aldehyde dehydrogenase